MPLCHYANKEYTRLKKNRAKLDSTKHLLPSSFRATFFLRCKDKHRRFWQDFISSINLLSILSITTAACMSANMGIGPLTTRASHVLVPIQSLSDDPILSEY